MWGACSCSTLRPCQTLGRAAGSVTLMPSGPACSSTFMLSDRACTLHRQPLCTLFCAHNWALQSDQHFLVRIESTPQACKDIEGALHMQH